MKSHNHHIGIYHIYTDKLHAICPIKPLSNNRSQFYNVIRTTSNFCAAWTITVVVPSAGLRGRIIEADPLTHPITGVPFFRIRLHSRNGARLLKNVFSKLFIRIPSRPHSIMYWCMFWIQFNDLEKQRTNARSYFLMNRRDARR